jgi:predicted dehydrogenase
MDSSSVREVLKQPILVVGCGSIGKRHINNLMTLGAQDIIVCDEKGYDYINEQLCNSIDAVTATGSIDEASKFSPIAALICTPTSEHLTDFYKVAVRVPNVFIEKPVWDGVTHYEGDVTVLADLRTLVACNFRFTPGLKKVKELIDSGAIGKVLSVRAQFGQYLPDQRENYQQSYAAHKSMGGGVILDRIHEFDYLTWLLGPIAEVKAFSGHLSSLEIDTEDVAEIICRFESGAIGSIHLDYMRCGYLCRCEMVGENGHLEWQYHREYIPHDATTYEHVYCFDGRKRVAEEVYVQTPNDMYLAELQHFLRICAGEEESCNTVSDAYRLLEVVLRCKQ